MADIPLPPDPQHAVLKKIYPWGDYNIQQVIRWLYAQAQKTGFDGTIDDFKERYGSFIDQMEHYDGPYDIMPSIDFDQILETANKIVGENITIAQIPYAETTNTAGGYTVTIG